MLGHRNADGNDEVKGMEENWWDLAQHRYDWSTWKRNADGTIEAPSPESVRRMWKKLRLIEGSEFFFVFLMFAFWWI